MRAVDDERLKQLLAGDDQFRDSQSST
jgi:hypothetical protein